MKDRTLIVHIGAPKTGSTEIQRWCSANRPKLAEGGVVYPQAAWRGYGHHDIAFLLQGGYPDWATPGPDDLAPLLTALRDEVAEARHVLLSSENFYLFPQPAKLAECLSEAGVSRGREIRILCYLRRQDDAAVSWWNQMVKAQGYTGDFEASYAETGAIWEYDAQLRAWSDAFGSDALIIRRYGEDLAFDVLGDFMTALDLPAPDPASRSSRTNVSLSRDLVEMQRIFNRLPVPIPQKRALHHELMELTTALAERLSDAPPLSRVQRQDLLARYAPGNQAVARKYFAEETLFSPAELGEDRPWSGLDNETILTVVGWLLLKREQSR